MVKNYPLLRSLKNSSPT